MLIWVYQYECIVQVITDGYDLETWVQSAAVMFPDAIYFYAGMTPLED